MQFWIFVISEYTDYWVGGFDQILGKMQVTKSYPLGHKTPNRTRVSVGDKVIFYKSGEDGRKFIGSAVISSITKAEKPFLYGYVHFSRIRIWQEPVSVYRVLSLLSFAKNKRRWQSYFQGGIRGIPRMDYERILRKV